MPVTPTPNDTEYAIKIAEMVNCTSIDANKSPTHAAMRDAEIKAQANFILKMCEINGHSVNMLRINTLTAIVDAQEAPAIKAAADAIRNA